MELNIIECINKFVGSTLKIGDFEVLVKQQDTCITRECPGKCSDKICNNFMCMIFWRGKIPMKNFVIF